ncbi:hypothetical protein [Microcystis sp. M061S2]|uniref:hypothetical protein n=1 Tax=Microcystis sp. M061S2 TaxID=2771171 RepID=UPI002583841B|nr:hypothetical protein [Microcystis sp. M061S2]MCA2654524.1 hypothetical protein [Microcystis sp. M061S2]
MENDFLINHVREHRLGQPGLFIVTASNEDALNKGIKKVFEQYPEFPYGTAIKRIYRDEMGQGFMADIQHWGSD